MRGPVEACARVKDLGMSRIEKGASRKWKSFFGVSIMRIMVFQGLYRSLLFYGNFQNIIK